MVLNLQNKFYSKLYHTRYRLPPISPFLCNTVQLVYIKIWADGQTAIGRRHAHIYMCKHIYSVLSVYFDQFQ
jgi:hypothetical protein